MEKQSQSAATVPTKHSLLPLKDFHLKLDSATAQILSASELAIRSLNPPSSLSATEAGIQSSVFTRAISDACLYLEGIASSKMYGRRFTVEQLFRVDLLERLAASDETERYNEMQCNIDALQAVQSLGTNLLTCETFSEIHRHVLTGTMLEPYQGCLRDEDKLVGGNRYSGLGTALTPPAVADIDELLVDLAAFANETTIPTVAQAALVHLQFIAIHPFKRANGKVARAIIPLVFVHRGLVNSTVPPVSVALMILPNDYQKLATCAMTELLDRSLTQKQIAEWLRFFSDCCQQAVTVVQDFENRCVALQKSWQQRLSLRSDSAASLLVNALPAIPVFTVQTAARYLDRSFKRVSAVIETLVDARIITQTTTGKRNRVFSCPDILELYTMIPGFQ